MLARRLRIPHPVLLVLVGAVLAVTPGLPRLEIDPDTAFLIFIPPLLYWTALTTSLREFKRGLWLIGRLGVLLVLVSFVVVAWVGHALSPELTWPAAFVLGAIVAPPDPVAATAVLRTLDAHAGALRALRRTYGRRARHWAQRDRAEQVISGDVMRRVQRDLDFETMVLEAADDDAPESPYLG